MAKSAEQLGGKLTAVDPPYLRREDFPDVGEHRFFVVKHNPKSRNEPIVIELRETMAEGKRLVGLSRLLGVEYAIADKERIVEKAKLLEARVGRVDDVVGVY